MLLDRRNSRLGDWRFGRSVPASHRCSIIFSKPTCCRSGSHPSPPFRRGSATDLWPKQVSNSRRGSAQDIPGLADRLTEERNPSKKRHVTRIFVKLPAERLREGVTFDGYTRPRLTCCGRRGRNGCLLAPMRSRYRAHRRQLPGLTQDDLVVVQALYQGRRNRNGPNQQSGPVWQYSRDRMIDYVKTDCKPSSELNHRSTRLALSVPRPSYAIAGLKRNCVRCSRVIEGSASPRKNGKTARCAKASSPLWSAVCTSALGSPRGSCAG